MVPQSSEVSGISFLVGFAQRNLSKATVSSEHARKTTWDFSCSRLLEMVHRNSGDESTEKAPMPFSSFSLEPKPSDQICFGRLQTEAKLNVKRGSSCAKLYTIKRNFKKRSCWVLFYWIFGFYHSPSFIYGFSGCWLDFSKAVNNFLVSMEDSICPITSPS